jgi:hypothetical protein
MEGGDGSFRSRFPVSSLLFAYSTYIHLQDGRSDVEYIHRYFQRLNTPRVQEYKVAENPISKGETSYR